MKKTKVMVVIDWFRPGYLAGGPILSVANLVRTTQGEIEWLIITSDKDFGAKSPYSGIQPNQWVDWEGKAKVWYCSSETKPEKVVSREIELEKPDVVYFNSLFSPQFTLKPLRTIKKLQYPPKIILAPRGMLHPGALAIKKLKKMAFLKAAKLTGLFKEVHFQATDKLEAEHIKAHFGITTTVSVVANLPVVPKGELEFTAKKEGELKLVFLSRISRKKNLDFLLKTLQGADFKCELSVVGPDEDQDYLAECKKLASSLPKNVIVNWKKSVIPKKVQEEISRGHLYVLPTHGENFGHSIFEAFAAGRPVLTSQLTPWRNLASCNSGWDLPLSNKNKWLKTLKEAAAWDQITFEKWASGARLYAENYLTQSEDKQKSINLFCSSPKGA